MRDKHQRLYATTLVIVTRLAFALAEAAGVECDCPEHDEADGVEVLRRLLLHVTRTSADRDYASR